MNFFSQVLYASETAFQCVLLFLVLRGPFKKYTVFAVFVLGAAASDVAENIAYYRLGKGSPAYRQLYWTDHVTQALLLFLVVISFTYAALHDSPSRAKAAKALGVIVVLTAAFPFTLLRNHYSPRHGFFTSQWFNHASQIWSFGAAIMNLVLWTALLSNRRRDPQLVSLSIGVGIATTSAAIGWGARQWLSEAYRWPVDSFMSVTHVTSVLVWCWVFWPKSVGRASAPPPAELSTT